MEIGAVRAEAQTDGARFGGDRAGEPIIDSDERGAESSVDKWAAVFRGGEVYTEAMARFTNFIPAGAGSAAWTWPSGCIREDESNEVTPPPQPLDSLSLFAAKEELATGNDRATLRIHELWPMTLMQTSSKVSASVANDELATIAKTTAGAKERGFVQGRSFADNIRRQL